MATGSEEGVHKCSESAEFYCNACHKKVCVVCNATRDHNIVRADDAFMCELHTSLPYVMYCKECKVPVCTKCIHYYHPKHLLVELHSVARASALVGVTKLFQVKLKNVTTCRHISCVDSMAWVSDEAANVVLTDLQGTQLEWVKTASGIGYHAVTGNGDFMFADQFKRCIYIIKKDKGLQTFIKTGSWRPISLCVSKINQNVLIGMYKDGKANMCRFAEDGTEIQRIQHGEKGENLYNFPSYVVENTVNADICVSDSGAKAVVVVDKHGGHRFTYTGRPSSQFSPSGICTDVLGNILVYAFEYTKDGKHDRYNGNVFLLSQNGELLSILLTFMYGGPQGICVDMHNRLWCGTWQNIQVHAYLRQDAKLASLKSLK